MQLLRKKGTEEDIQVIIEQIHAQANAMSLPDPLIPSTDAYVTSICFIGSKSLSHVLSCIERCKERLLAIGPTSEPARRQIIASVLSYWRDQPGVGVNIIDKLLNYTILTPMSVIEWALVEHNERGSTLSQAHIYEMVSSTVFKVTNRVRQVVDARNAPELPADQVAMLEETMQREEKGMRELFAVLEEALVGFATGSKDEVVEMSDGDSESDALVRSWGERWLRVFRRKFAVEEAFVQDALAKGQGTDGAMEVVETGA